MTGPRAFHSHKADQGHALLAAVRARVPHMQALGAALDADTAFPAEDVQALSGAGLLAAPVPVELGGVGAGTEPDGARLALELLGLCGRGNAAVGRLFEAHVNALRLVMRYGTREQARRAAQDAIGGHLFGLWVTDAPGQALRTDAGRLWGRKGPCSGAGHCTRAVVTAESEGTIRLVLVALSGQEPVALVTGLQGMRAAANGTVTLDGVPAPAEAWIGQPGDYLREPDFSCGAWRTSAVAAGVLDALVDEAAAGLRRRGQTDAPMQQARFGEVLIAQETVRLWVERAALLAEAKGGDAAAQVAYVNLARIAVEAACLDALRHVQRCLGLGAFVAPHPVERLGRDLSTYLRQPAPDAVLLEAAAWHLRRPAC